MFGTGMLLSGARDVGFPPLLHLPASLMVLVLCIGYNGLHQLPKEATDDDDDDDDENPGYNPVGDGIAEPVNKEQNYPDGKRQWIWLVLCDDGEHVTHLLSECFGY